jgi:hypothetical protein
MCGLKRIFPLGERSCFRIDSTRTAVVRFVPKQSALLCSVDVSDHARNGVIPMSPHKEDNRERMLGHLGPVATENTIPHGTKFTQTWVPILRLKALSRRQQ